MPLVTYRLGTMSFSRALMSFGCHSMCFMHLGGFLKQPSEFAWDVTCLDCYRSGAR